MTTTTVKRRNITLDLELAHPRGGQACDPAYYADNNIIVAWASNVWEADRCLPDMKMAMRVQRQRLNACTSENEAWKHVTGPAGAALMTAKRVGWAFASATKIIDHLGEQVDLAIICPMQVSKRVQEATRMRLHKGVAKALGEPALEKGIFIEPVRKIVFFIKNANHRSVRTCTPLW